MAEPTVLEPAGTPPAAFDDGAVASLLEEIADLLEEQGANPFRVRAYRNAAVTVKSLPRPVAEILAARGRAGLDELPGIGESLARTIEALSHDGTVAMLERLRGGTGPVDLFTTVAGIGPELARRIHEHLGIHDLVELSACAVDGRLARVPGMGPARVRAVRESLAGRLRRPAPAPPAPTPHGRPADEPPVEEILDVDAEYRRKARAGRLPRVAPRRFNPTREAWLPVLHTERSGRHYTALFSNTARAHELGTTHDWVVVYRDDQDGDGRWTVVTSRLGRLRGRRIVRGREAECEAVVRRAAD